LTEEDGEGGAFLFEPRGGHSSEDVWTLGLEPDAEEFEAGGGRDEGNGIRIEFQEAVCFEELNGAGPDGVDGVLVASEQENIVGVAHPF